MLYNPRTYTVESVTSGHPDKICDQVSDAIVDACLSQDLKSRVAVECLGTHGLLVIGGEITTKAEIHAPSIARKIYKRIGYKDKLKIITKITVQSPDISRGVDNGGAGDQGIMYGFATDETSQYLPKALILAHRLALGLEELRREDQEFDWLMPDGKSQVTVSNGQVASILISCQHKEAISQKEIKSKLTQKLVSSLLSNFREVEILVNPTGKFIKGGFEADTGLTGRKIMVDTYGGLAPHGGGCFSGKDPSKVDRSAAYMARFVANNVVAQGLAKKCLVSVSYAIGKAEPLMLEAVDEKGRSLSGFVKKHYDFRPLAIIERLGLRSPIYLETATYGHFGKEGFPWEKIND